VTGNTPPNGNLYHATNIDHRTRTIVPFRYENRPVSDDPTASRSMVVSLKICSLALQPMLVQHMDHNIRPFEPIAQRRRPPRGEPDCK
jgi:hypothetical protein